MYGASFQSTPNSTAQASSGFQVSGRNRQEKFTCGNYTITECPSSSSHTKMHMASYKHVKYDCTKLTFLRAKRSIAGCHHPQTAAEQVPAHPYTLPFRQQPFAPAKP